MCKEKRGTMKAAKIIVVFLFLMAMMACGQPIQPIEFSNSDTGRVHALKGDYVGVSYFRGKWTISVDIDDDDLRVRRDTLTDALDGMESKLECLKSKK